MSWPEWQNTSQRAGYIDDQNANPLVWQRCQIQVQKVSSLPEFVFVYQLNPLFLSCNHFSHREGIVYQTVHIRFSWNTTHTYIEHCSKKLQDQPGPSLRKKSNVILRLLYQLVLFFLCRCSTLVYNLTVVFYLMHRFASESEGSIVPEGWCHST